MSSVSTENLLVLIRSMTKAEKRSFKLFAGRNTDQSGELKFVQLFNYIDHNPDYSDSGLLNKVKDISKVQLPNLKAHLYKQILASLRLQQANKSLEMEVRESIDNAAVLYHKGFHLQALRQLEKTRLLAERLQSVSLQLEVVELEKRIETQYITRALSSRAEILTQQSLDLKDKLFPVIHYSNLCLQLYSLYLKVGFVRDEKESNKVKTFFRSKMIEFDQREMSFEACMHLYNAQVWHYHIIQDFVMCYRYARLWVDLFLEFEEMQIHRREMYLKGQNYLLSALFNLRNYERFIEALNDLENTTLSTRDSENVHLLYYQYLYTAKINRHYLEGSFDEGLKLLPDILNYIESVKNKIDPYRVIVFYYKIACLYFGNGDNREAINYLNLVIQFKEKSLQEDIQCFARILNLITHFELGNDLLVEYQIKSVYRFLIKMGDLQGVQREIFNFLRQLPFQNEQKLNAGFKELHKKLVELSRKPFEKRPFLYLDIISWLECKLEGLTVQEVIRRKFLEEQKSGTKKYFPTD